MTSFLQETIQLIYRQRQGFDGVVFILPNKRAGLYLKKYISEEISSPIIIPKIYSVEEFIGDLSGLEAATQLDLLLELYEAFTVISETEKEGFDSFVNWGNTLLNDFIELDRHLADSKSIFDYLVANHRIKAWGLPEKRTALLTNTLEFWNQLSPIYEKFNAQLTKKGVGHQGLLYRTATNNIAQYLKDNQEQHYYFIGFNALNTAEESIIQHFLNQERANIIWDLDIGFFEDPIHESGFFIRNFIANWPFYKRHKPQGFSNHFLKKKNIQITGIPKYIAQAKYVGKTIEDILKKNPKENIAVVLGDETLLSATLNSLPIAVDKVNITMGLPLKKTTLFGFFEALFDIHSNNNQKGWHYKDMVRFLSNPYALRLLQSEEHNLAQTILNHIREKNLFYLNPEALALFGESTSDFLFKLFPVTLPLKNKAFLETTLEIIQQLKTQLQDSQNHLELHQLYGFFTLFNQLKNYLATKPYLKTLKSLRAVFNELVATEQIDFRGEPMEGIQIMGMLESRNLDFETVIITSVNEGILPAGKTQNSFIPYDIKKEYNLPTHKEKDAVYAYHFYRLLQRAKNVYITYNTEPDVLLGGEKSRFISQLLTDSNINQSVTHTVATPEISLTSKAIKKIHKTPKLLSRLHEMAEKGFSPSALTNYIKNPYDFYKKNVLGLKDSEEIEEQIAANTFGTIVHDTLEELYTPLIGHFLSNKNLEPIKHSIPSLTKKNFGKFYSDKDIGRGQNLIAYHVIQKYIHWFVEADIKRSMESSIQLIALEESLKTKINVPNVNRPIYIKGKLDRVEKLNDLTQVLDYKTGNVTPSEVEITDLAHTISNEKRSKAFQLLCYSLLLKKEKNPTLLQAGIVPIKKMSAGVLHFAVKNSPNASTKNTLIESGLLNSFETLLGQLVLEILNPAQSFENTESGTL